MVICAYGYFLIHWLIKCKSTPLVIKEKLRRFSRWGGDTLPHAPPLKCPLSTSRSWLRHWNELN